MWPKIDDNFNTSYSFLLILARPSSLQSYLPTYYLSLSALSTKVFFSNLLQFLFLCFAFLNLWMTSNWSQQCPLSSHCSLSPTHQSLRYVGDNFRNSREKTVRRRIVIVTRILGTSFMDYPGWPRTRKEVFWFCHQCSSLHSNHMLCSDNRQH